MTHKSRLIVLALGLLFLMLGSLTVQPAAAQSVEAHFHRGAQAYIAEDFEEAEAQVEAGLRLDPSNEKLQALREKLEQERQQQSGSSSDDSQQRSEPSDDQDTDDAQQGESGEEDEEERRADQQQEEQGGSEQQEEEPQGGDEEEEDREESEGDIGPDYLQEDPNELSREQAERILQALRDQEEQLLNQVLRREERSRRVEKEW